MNDLSPIGHNNPPSPIETTIAPFSDAIEEAQNWLDGERVENEDQMNAVDAILKDVRSAGTALAAAQKEATAPLHDAWKAEIALWKPAADDLEAMKKGLAALVGDFKKKLAAEKEAARQAAWAESQRLEREARQAAETADAANIEEQREAAAKMAEAQAAKQAASAAQKDTVKGLRTVTHHNVEDMRGLVNWIATNDKPAMASFADEYARKNHSNIPDAIVRTWTTKEAY